MPVVARCLVAVLLLGSCQSAPQPDGEMATETSRPAPSNPDPAVAVAVVASGCGHSSDAIGSGVLLADGLVLTVAHAVAGSSHVNVMPLESLPTTRQWPEFSATRLLATADPASRATVVAFDTRSDLALLSLTSTTNQGNSEAPFNVSFTAPEVDMLVEIRGVAKPGITSGVITRTATIVTDEVRQADRVERLGFLINAVTEVGDSGAGVWNGVDLVGLLFAVTADDNGESWAVSGTEIETFIADWTEQPAPPSWACDEDQSKLVPSEG